MSKMRKLTTVIGTLVLSTLLVIGMLIMPTKAQADDVQQGELINNAYFFTGKSGLQWGEWLTDITTGKDYPITPKVSTNTPWLPAAVLAAVPASDQGNSFEIHFRVINSTTTNQPYSFTTSTPYTNIYHPTYNMFNLYAPIKVTSDGSIGTLLYDLNSQGDLDNAYTDDIINQTKIEVGLRTYDGSSPELEPGRYLEVTLPVKFTSDVQKRSIYAQPDDTTGFYQLNDMFYSSDYDFDSEPNSGIELVDDPGYDVQINYVDEEGKEIAPSKVIEAREYSTQNDDKIDLQTPIDGYTIDATSPATYEYNVADGQKSESTSSPHVITLTYKKNTTPTEPTTPTNPTTPTTPTTPSTPSTPTTTPTTPTTPTEPTTPSTTTTDNTTDYGRVAVKGQAIYAIRKVGLYRNAQFGKQQRIKYYPKAKRINRPEFVVKGYKEDKAGHLRYRVQQYNPYTKRYIKGTTGYLTASDKYVVPAYYATKPKTNKIKVINPKGLYEYNNAALTGKRSKHVKAGATLKVTKISKYKYTTRYRLSNGKFVTANKKFVIFK